MTNSRTEAVVAEKQRLRALAQQARRGQTDKDLASAAIGARLLDSPQYKGGRTVLFYVDARSEVRTRSALATALADGKRIAVPYCVEDRLELFLLEHLDELAPGRFGILEPRVELRTSPARKVQPAEIELAIVPGVAFDLGGSRLGHGQGFYDRLLAELNPAAARIGLAYECQLFPYVPAEEHDVRLHKVITEHDTYEADPRTSADASGFARLSMLHVATHVEHHATIGSTNDRAREASSVAPREHRLLVVADEQTAGRGRGANRWWTGAGSLACSLLFDPAVRGIERRHCHLISLAAAIAVVDAVRTRVAGHELGLHWPNDVFAAGRKLAGVLVEALPDGRHIVGVGVNVNNSLAFAPDDLRSIATSLVDLTGAPLARVEVISSLLLALDRQLDDLSQDADRVGRTADALCLQHGRDVTIESGQRRASGWCAGIAADGALLLETSAGRERFYSGVLVKHSE